MLLLLFPADESASQDSADWRADGIGCSILSYSMWLTKAELLEIKRTPSPTDDASLRTVTIFLLFGPTSADGLLNH